MGKRYHWYYEDIEQGGIIRVSANRKPSSRTCPGRGTWGVREFDGKSWIMPCFPEITWGRLSKLQFIGKVAND